MHQASPFNLAVRRRTMAAHFATAAATMHQHEKINYLEFPTRDIAATKRFFERVFGWQFTDYGPEYAAFAGAGIDGGCFQAPTPARTQNGSALIVFYSADLEATLEKVTAAGAVIDQAIFDFPGGRRFHFSEPGGSEFAVWSEPAA
jgi:predicted enzyme related to lactoylglutathione lyase